MIGIIATVIVEGQGNAWCTSCGDTIAEGQFHSKLMRIARAHVKANDGHEVVVQVTRELTIGTKG